MGYKGDAPCCSEQIIAKANKIVSESPGVTYKIVPQYKVCAYCGNSIGSSTTDRCDGCGARR